MLTILRGPSKEIIVNTDGPVVMIGEKINPTGNKKLAQALLEGRLEFASLRLEEPSINLVKTAAGVWNFQPLLSQAAAVRPPAIAIRGGRLNFKLGGVKSVFYFSDADLDAVLGYIRWLRHTGPASG